jgi:hypothetical protein
MPHATSVLWGNTDRHGYRSRISVAHLSLSFASFSLMGAGLVALGSVGRYKEETSVDRQGGSLGGTREWGEKCADWCQRRCRVEEERVQTWACALSPGAGEESDGRKRGGNQPPSLSLDWMHLKILTGSLSRTQRQISKLSCRGEYRDSTHKGECGNL